jgi:hypothetical protein
MLMTIAAVAVLLQATPTPPVTPRAPRPKVKVHVAEPPAAPEAPHRWSPRDDDETGLLRDTTFAVREGQRLEVSNFSGSITVTAWNENKVRIQSTASSDPFEVDIGSITVDVNSHGGRYGGPGDAELTIQVPAWMDLELSGNEVDISTRGTRGAVSASTIQGRVSVDGGEGSVELSSVEGDIIVANVKGRIEVNTTEGQITVTNAGGEALEIESVDGDIEMSGITTLNVSANTVDGQVSWAGVIAPTGSYRFSSHDGDLVLRIAGEPDATISVDTYDGTLESDWPLTIKPGGRSSNRKTFTLGSGRARVELSSFDGNISLRRAPGR